mmetsp:Transcript_116469/g.292913  ORF Transcript_116469/g.292913 Transcript_116469/m.292913 type:complete len:351 (-) Transcript_116469:1005-2057(-)
MATGPADSTALAAAGGGGVATRALLPTLPKACKLPGAPANGPAEPPPPPPPLMPQSGVAVPRPHNGVALPPPTALLRGGVRTTGGGCGAGGVGMPAAGSATRKSCLLPSEGAGATTRTWPTEAFMKVGGETCTTDDARGALAAVAATGGLTEDSRTVPAPAAAGAATKSVALAGAVAATAGAADGSGGTGDKAPGGRRPPEEDEATSCEALRDTGSTRRGPPPSKPLAEPPPPPQPPKGASEERSRPSPGSAAAAAMPRTVPPGSRGEAVADREGLPLAGAKRLKSFAWWPSWAPAADRGSAAAEAEAHALLGAADTAAPPPVAMRAVSGSCSFCDPSTCMYATPPAPGA